MSLLIRFFKLLFLLYAFVVFITTVVLFFPVYLVIFYCLPAKKSPHVAHAWSRVWAKVLFTFFMMRCEVEGKEKIDPEATYIFVSNHQSQLDIPLFACACRNTFRFLAKAELVKIPLVGYVIKKLYLTVNRQDRRDRSKSMGTMLRSLHDGISVFICPEGTRNRTDQPLLPFKDGAFRLAIEAQMPVAVLTVYDTKKRHAPLRPLELSPGTIHAIWSDPIPTKGMTEDDLPALKEKVRNYMLQHLEHKFWN